MNQTSIQNKLNNRVAILYNHITATNNGKIYVCHDSDQGTLFTIESVRNLLVAGCFSNFVNVSVEGEGGQYGPNVKPSRKALNRLTKLINGTNYRIVQQQGQQFTLEGEN